MRGVAAALLLVAQVCAAYEWPQALQGHDDASYTAMMIAQGQTQQLTERYKHIAAMQPGIRRYNMFWSGLEPLPSSASPQQCRSGLTLVPANETDRAARGYNNFHCYNIPSVAAFDTLLPMDNATGAHHAAIFWNAPEWAIYENCTGFPWGKQMDRGGCVPKPEYMADFEDYVLFHAERYSPASAYAPLRHYVVWNEVISAGWMDMSPRVPNRIAVANTTGDQQLTPAEFNLWADVYAQMMRAAARAATRHNPEAIVWFSSDHFWLSPVQKQNDTLHISLKRMLDAIWERVGVDIDWGLVVHPYDGGDPRQDVWADGIYTFATLQHLADYQAAQLQARGLAPKDNKTGMWRPQMLLYPSEQGWPTHDLSQQKQRARNICYAQNLSQNVSTIIGVTHNLFQMVPGASQGGAVYGLISDLVNSTLDNGAGHPCYDAYVATSPSQWQKNASNYCCATWQTGCP